MSRVPNIERNHYDWEKYKVTHRITFLLSKIYSYTMCLLCIFPFRCRYRWSNCIGLELCLLAQLFLRIIGYLWVPFLVQQLCRFISLDQSLALLFWWLLLGFRLRRYRLHLISFDFFLMKLFTRLATHLHRKTCHYQGQVMLRFTLSYHLF